ncbi:MAG: PKD domain-containing protein [Candidatus Bathyarchaeia archaeon]
MASLLLVTLLAALSASAHLPDAETYAPAALTPTIDGKWSAGEWADAPQHNLSGTGGYFRIKHDDSYVYVIIDLINEGSHWAGCHFIYFDTAHDGGNDTELPGDLQFHCCVPPNKLGFGSSPNSATKHRITEFKVALTDLGSPSLPVEMGFYIKALEEEPDPEFVYEWPIGAGGSAIGLDKGYWWDGTPVPDKWGDIHIEAPPEPPVARFTPSPPKPYVNGTVTFNASASYDPDGSIANYTWDFDDGNVTTVSTPVIYHTYTANDTYTVTLNVTDTQGLWNTTSKTITVLSAPPPPYGPTADFTYSPSSPGMNKKVTFDALDSLPGWNGTHVMPIANYTWSFGDNNVTTTTNPVIMHVYTAVGTYTVNLTVMCEDDPVLIAEGLTSNSTWQNITVLDKTAPTIANVVQSPVAAEVDPDENVTVTAIDVIDDVAVDNVLLMYSTDNVTFKNVTMVLVSGTNNYTAQIPGQTADTYVTYKIFANDTSGNPYETSIYAYRVKKGPSAIPWLWIVVMVTAVIIAIVAIYMVTRKRSA